MSGTRVRVVGNPTTHIVAWKDHLGGYAHCGVDFAWQPDDHRTNARSVAAVVKADCDCMTCLVKSNRDMIGFQTYEETGVTVTNLSAVSRLKLFDEE